MVRLKEGESLTLGSNCFDYEVGHCVIKDSVLQRSKERAIDPFCTRLSRIISIVG